MSLVFLQNFRSKLDGLFSVRIVDEHLVIRLFTLKFCKKFKYEYNFQEINDIGINTESRNPRIIVSLTTFPARINTVYKTVTTLLQQTVKPDILVLWLAEEQFPNKQLPENLVNLEKYGLTIKWCKDIRSFKKLIPSLKEYPNDIIITADDDIFYPNNFVESLYNQYLKYPKFISANRAFLVKKKKENFYIMKSRSYIYDDTYLPHFTNEFMTGYGTLFPPNSLDKDVFRDDIFMKIIPTNDDVWFWAMALKKGTKVSVNPNGYKLKLIIDRTVQDCALWKKNMKNTTTGISGNDSVNLMRKTFEEVDTCIKSEIN